MQIDYEKEVKKVYPKAYLHSRVVRDWAYEIRIPFLLFFSKAISSKTFVKQNVWKRAWDEMHNFKN